MKSTLIFIVLIILSTSIFANNKSNVLNNFNSHESYLESISANNNSATAILEISVDYNFHEYCIESTCYDEVISNSEIMQDMGSNWCCYGMRTETRVIEACSDQGCNAAWQILYQMLQW
jgi:hypothetical protein